jgi:hypothetical protein
MKREKFYLCIILVLLLVNLGTLFFIIQRQGPGHKRGNVPFDHFLEEELSLSDKQRMAFEEMKMEHHQQMIKLDAEINKPFEDYFSLIVQKGDPVKKDSLELVLSNIYKQKASATYLHFQQLYSLCSDSQKEKFNNIIPHLLQVIGSNHRPGPPH